MSASMMSTSLATLTSPCSAASPSWLLPARSPHWWRESGSGKSRVISLITAFQTLTPARFFSTSGSRRRRTGQLFAATSAWRSCRVIPLRRNYPRQRGILGDDATEEQILEAARISHVDEFHHAFPEGYDTIVGERGVKLSGGQRQRRLHRPCHSCRSTHPHPRGRASSLDSEWEALIQEGLAYLMRGRRPLLSWPTASPPFAVPTQILVIDGGLADRSAGSRCSKTRGRATISTPASTLSEQPLPHPPVKQTFSRMRTRVCQRAANGQPVTGALRGRLN